MQHFHVSPSLRSKILLYLAVIGPGLVVMLADTDAGSIITAAQSGALWGYKLLALQIILIPVLYIAQELTVRLGIVTGMGHGELIKEQFGSFCAWLSVGTLLVCCVGAIITEFSGLAAVGNLFGVPSWISMCVVIGFLSMIAWTGTYRSVEMVAMAIGGFELIFLVVAWHARPSLVEITQGLTSIPLHNSNYLYMVAANIGAVIMPWMIFYQQSAVIDKGLTTPHLKPARWDTAFGAIVTQAVMAAVLITIAATIGKNNPNAPLTTVHQISDALTPTLGATAGRILFALAMTGAALVAAIVVSLTAAWGLGELMGYRRSLQDHPLEAPWFYGIYTATLIIGGLVVVSGVNLVELNIGVEVMNALLLPLVLGFLYMLALKSLPDNYKLRGWYAWLVAFILGITSLFGLYAGVLGTIKGW